MVAFQNRAIMTPQCVSGKSLRPWWGCRFPIPLPGPCGWEGSLRPRQILRKVYQKLGRPTWMNSTFLLRSKLCPLDFPRPS